jgi:hypothetical protein
MSSAIKYSADQFMASHAEAVLRCMACGKGRLQPGSIGQRSLMVCTQCKGMFVPLSSGATDHPELSRRVIADILWIIT